MANEVITIRLPKGCYVDIEAEGVPGSVSVMEDKGKLVFSQESDAKFDVWSGNKRLYPQDDDQIPSTAVSLLDVPMQRNDAGAKTIGDYLKALLARVWEEEEGFSGKRPFGNSGWKDEVFQALFDADRRFLDEQKADQVIKNLIASMKLS